MKIALTKRLIFINVKAIELIYLYDISCDTHVLLSKIRGALLL